MHQSTQNLNVLDDASWIHLLSQDPVIASVSLSREPRKMKATEDSPIKSASTGDVRNRLRQQLSTLHDNLEGFKRTGTTFESDLLHREQLAKHKGLQIQRTEKVEPFVAYVKATYPNLLADLNELANTNVNSLFELIENMGMYLFRNDKGQLQLSIDGNMLPL